MPNLRKRSFSFIASKLWRVPEAADDPPTPRERRIFLTYGTIAATASTLWLFWVAWKYGHRLIGRYQLIGLLLFIAIMVVRSRSRIRRLMPKQQPPAPSSPGEGAPDPDPAGQGAVVRRGDDARPVRRLHGAQDRRGRHGSAAPQRRRARPGGRTDLRRLRLRGRRGAQRRTHLPALRPRLPFRAGEDPGHAQRGPVPARNARGRPPEGRDRGRRRRRS